MLYSCPRKNRDWLILTSDFVYQGTRVFKIHVYLIYKMVRSRTQKVTRNMNQIQFVSCSISKCSYYLVLYPTYTGWPRENGTGYFPQYMDVNTGISVWGRTSPKKSDTKISNFGSVVCFLEQILWGNVKAHNFPFSASTSAEKMPFRLAIYLWAVMQLNWSMRIPYTRNPLVNNAHWQS